MKIIPGFEKYRITEDGIIESFAKNYKTSSKSRTLKSSTDKDGYLKVVLFTALKTKHDLRVHRLVASTYIGKIPDGMVVNHKDGNIINNHHTNLEIITPAENERHSRRVLGKRCVGEKASRSKLVTTDILWIVYFKHHMGYSVRDISEKKNISDAQVRRILRCENWGHLWINSSALHVTQKTIYRWMNSNHFKEISRVYRKRAIINLKMKFSALDSRSRVSYGKTEMDYTD